MHDTVCEILVTVWLDCLVCSVLSFPRYMYVGCSTTVLTHYEHMHFSMGQIMSKRKQWWVGSMRAAVKGMEEGMGLREAVHLYNVPLKALRR